LEQQLILNLQSKTILPCGFTQEAFFVAQKIISFRDTDALIYIALRQYDDFNDEIDQVYWTEIRRACKYIQACRAYWFEGHHWRMPVYD
tara:strand:- start:62 stop:328 length:267 start_codon:yes stop_codon:yes gene_type:complete